MVCPVTLTTLNKMLQALQHTTSMQEKPQVLFITVDPERDDTTQLNKYINAFNKQFIGARTTLEKTSILLKQFHVTATKTEQKDKINNHYLMIHSAEILLINPDARIQAYFRYPPHPEQMVKDFRAILRQAQREKT